MVHNVCVFLCDYMAVNSELQLTPSHLSPMLSPVRNPRGSVAFLVAQICQIA